VSRVSVIIPAHNAAATLPETLRSVFGQTYTDWECIVVDDASTDDTLALAELRDPRVRVVRSVANVGPAGARNLAVEAASGELLAFLDADDMWDPRFLQTQVAAYDAGGPGVGIVACDAYFLTPAGRGPRTYAEVYGRADGVGLTDLLRANRIFVSALVPRQVVAQVGAFSTACWGSEDHDLWLRIVAAGYRVVATETPLVDYRVRDASVSASVLGMARTSQATYRRALARGGLTARQRLIAWRHLLLQRSVEAVALRRAAPLASAIPVIGLTVVLHPDRWLSWMRMVRETLAARRTERR
jgi:glycosyltransferase involved in cell wall biosynthesis